MIVVTGANGHFGRAVVEQLLARVDPSRIGVSVRDPDKAQAIEARGVRVRRGDFTDGASLRVAFEGATQVLLVSSNAAATGGDPIAQHQTAIAAAKAAGVKRIIYTSHMGASPASAFHPCVDHATTEDMLRQSGVAFTSLRNGFYASTALDAATKSIATGELRAPADGKVAWTSRADLAEAAAVVLVQEGLFDGPTPPLTAGEAVDFRELAAMVSALTGRSIAHVVVSDDDFRKGATAKGMSAQMAGFVLTLYLAARAGEFSAVHPALERVLGRKPTSVRDSLTS